MAIRTTDPSAHHQEYIQTAASAVGKGVSRQKVFKAIYAGKRPAKTVRQLMEATGLSRVRVLQEGGKLAAHEVVEQEKFDGETAYRKKPFIQQHKGKILGLAGNPAKLLKFPTKWAPTRVREPMITVKLTTRDSRVQQITVDDIASFSAVKKVLPNGNLPSSISEKKFKQGIQRILGQGGTFKDWGGETNDLFTTRVRINGKRKAAAFGFKGPGLRGKLNPGRMGKNGDQIQRLFQSPADLFIVQHWREIDEAVLQQMQQLAVAKSVLTGSEILYGVIDGQDSRRIYEAYKSKF
jgi:hypothetical protein